MNKYLHIYLQTTTIEHNNNFLSPLIPIKQKVNE